MFRLLSPLLALSALLLVPAAAAAQVEFTAGPQEGQLYPRDLATNRASVPVEGLVTQAGMSQVHLDVTRDGAPWWQGSAPLQYNPATGGASFSFAPDIEAGLHDYAFAVSLEGGGSVTPVRDVSDVVCGDAFLMDGQSNTVAGGFPQTSVWRSKWIRSFGTSSTSANQVQANQEWHLANGGGSHGSGCIGAWGLRMARHLVDTYQVPVAVLNGAVGATPVSWHQRVDQNPEDLGTIYGRLLFRARKAGLAEHFRAILWHQGEADGGRTARGYLRSWLWMHADWMEDYPSVERVFLFQIRMGCSVPGDDMNIREAQRRLPDLVPGLTAIPTAGVFGHDGCHYNLAGYRRIGDLAAVAVAAELYDAPLPTSAAPPNLFKARFTTPARDEIELLFRDPTQELLLDPGIESTFRLRGNSGESVVAATASPGRILLQLSGPSTAGRVAYVGNSGNGPWIRNVHGVGAFTFQARLP